jgi:uncharacterized SAM-dependent methyltransferase
VDEVDPLDGDVPEAQRVAGRAIPVAIRLLTEWSTDDPGLAESLRQISAMPEYEPERHEAEAFLHMIQARAAWRKADELRALERGRTKREQRLAAGRAADGRRRVVKAVCPSDGCGALVRLRVDGMLREHDPGSGAARFGNRDGRCAGSGHPPGGLAEV